jgi:hypothetical protein
MDSEMQHQSKYFSSFGLQRKPIIGDGNCLFWAISFSLFGHQDNHLQLQNLAVDTFRGNVGLFQDYFHEDGGMPEYQINILSQPTTKCL